MSHCQIYYEQVVSRYVYLKVSRLIWYSKTTDCLKMSLPFIILSTVVFITFVTSSAAHLNVSFNCKRPSLLMKPIMIVTKHDWHWLDNMNVPGCWMQTAFTPTTPTSDRTRDKATSLLWDTDNTGMTRSRVPQEVRCVSELSPAHVTCYIHAGTRDCNADTGWYGA